MPDGDDIEKRAEQLYNAVVLLLRDRGIMGLLVAVGDARDGISWANAHTKTRELFHLLDANLT